MSLTINIAARGRPELLHKTIEETLPNIVRGDTVLMVSSDDDDESILDMEWPWQNVLLSIEPREDSRGAKYDRALTRAPADVYLPAVDCAPILTKGFDQIIHDKAALFTDGIGVVRTPYINNVFPPALQAVTAGWVKQVGYIYNPDYPFWFIDHEVHDLARLAGRYAFANVQVETASMRPKTTWRLRDVAFWATYYDFMALERRQKAREIIDASDAPEWVKEHLRHNYHGIEHEAKIINDNVRRNAAEIEQSRGDPNPPDEGYLRAKARAEQKLSQLLETLKAA